MRLLFLSNSFPNALSATRGTFNLSLWRAVAAEHHVRVVSPVSWIEEFAARRCGHSLGDRTLNFEPQLTATYPRFWYPPRCLRPWYGSYLWWSIERHLKREITDFRPDAIVSYWAHPDGEAAVRAGKWAGIPAVTMVGGSDVLLLGRSGSRRRAILSVLKSADAVVPVSRNIAHTLIADGLPAAKIRVIPRGVNRDVFHPGDSNQARTNLNLPRDRPLLVAVGRLVPVKGFDILIDAVQLLVRRRSDNPVPHVANVLCCIVGSGELHGKLSAQIERHDLQEHVRLVGAQGQQELADWYRAADYTVLSSHSEGIPNVLLESLCCGTPFVATRVGGVADIADERYHDLVPPGNAAALATALASRLASMSVSSDTDVPCFIPPTWESSAQQLCSLIETLRSSHQPLTVGGDEGFSHALPAECAIASPQCSLPDFSFSVPAF